MWDRRKMHRERKNLRSMNEKKMAVREECVADSGEVLRYPRKDWKRRRRSWRDMWLIGGTMRTANQRMRLFWNREKNQNVELRESNTSSLLLANTNRMEQQWRREQSRKTGTPHAEWMLVWARSDTRWVEREGKAALYSDISQDEQASGSYW
jgi:hypothetical protein